METKDKKINSFIKFIVISIVLLIILNILSRWRSFCDFYTDNIYRIWANTYGRFMGLFPFSMGEILIAIVVLILVIGIILGLVIFVTWLIKYKNVRLKKFYLAYYKMIISLIIIVGYLMTFNCSIPYNCSKIVFENEQEIKFGKEEVLSVRNYVVEQLNELCTEVERDGEGCVQLPDDYYDEVKNSLRALSSEFPRMRGYYPNPKSMFGSYFMYQTGTIGIYFPFTLEANYCSYLSNSYKPSVIAHELSHLKGYMYEDEANFMAYLACVSSDNKSIQYSGYIGVYTYFVDLCFQYEYDENDYILDINELVYEDSDYFSSEGWKKIENTKPIISSEIMNSIDDNFTDSYMDYYEVEPNYHDVAGLIIRYYMNKLY